MSVTTLERFPKTVSACHAEIVRLRIALENAEEGASSDRILELEGERDELKDQLKAAETENEALEDRVKELEENDHPDVIDAVDNFLYQVERPVGAFKFDVVHEPATDRAIVRLYDAVGRQP